MKCRRCGAYIADGVLRCTKCGEDVRIVPDYNPLDEVLAAQVKGSIDGSKRPLDDIEYHTRRMSVGSQNASAKPRQMTPEERKKRAQRKREIKRRKRIRAMMLSGFALVLLLVIAVIFYQFSYGSRVKKGYRYLERQEYTKSEEYFKKAIRKNPEKGKAYKGIAELYVKLDESEKAEELLLTAIDDHPDSAEVYEAAFSFYILTKKETEIPVLLDGADEKVVDALGYYACDVPKFSLDEEEAFEDVQQLSLESDEAVIYYTTDGSDPFRSETKVKYDEPIQISEGETTVKAVAVNKNKIPGRTISKTYTVEPPIEDSPAVSPSTGQYDDYTEIRITVPDGYQAFYTMDGTNPTADSDEYTGPIDMPSGSTIFKAVLVNSKGRLSNVTTRNYELTAE